MQGIAQILPNYTIADWEQWEGRWELINGVPFAMSPMPHTTHQRVCGKAYLAFANALEKTGCSRCEVYQPLNYKISETTIFHPDMLVLCGEQPGMYLERPPALILEVLSRSTMSKDRFAKYHTYREEGVRYYLIAEPKTKMLEVYELQGDDYVKTFEDGSGEFLFSLEEGCAIAVETARFWD